MRQKSTARAILPLALHDRLKWSYDTSEMHDKVKRLTYLFDHVVSLTCVDKCCHNFSAAKLWVASC